MNNKYYIGAFKRAEEEFYHQIYSGSDYEKMKAWARRVVSLMPDGSAKIYREGPNSTLKRENGQTYKTGLICVFEVKKDLKGGIFERGK